MKTRKVFFYSIKQRSKSFNVLYLFIKQYFLTKIFSSLFKNDMHLKAIIKNYIKKLEPKNANTFFDDFWQPQKTTTTANKKKSNMVSKVKNTYTIRQVDSTIWRADREYPVPHINFAIFFCVFFIVFHVRCVCDCLFLLFLSKQAQ